MDTRVPVRLIAILGVLCVFGGEAFCIVGPLQYERQIHVTCHAILYAGVGLVALAAPLHWKGR
jgi:hypothetical protein